MGKTLYVGNLPYGTSDNALENLVEPHGRVQSAQIILDRNTSRSKTCRFVEMNNAVEAQAPIDTLNSEGGSGRALTVDEARPGDERLWRSGLEFSSDFFG
jgi:cold-inducible RNA-binding protein